MFIASIWSRDTRSASVWGEVLIYRYRTYIELHRPFGWYLSQVRVSLEYLPMIQCGDTNDCLTIRSTCVIKVLEMLEFVKGWDWSLAASTHI